MTGAFRLLGRVLALRVPPRALVWGALNKVHFLLRTGNRRFEFERLYAERGDPWDYQTSRYELAKYRHTLEQLLAWRRGAERALEVGCSIGVFTPMLARHFARVDAIDVSREALRAARARCRYAGNVHLLRGALQSLRLGARYDVIVCAEVLYYIAEKESDRVRQKLDEHLAADGIIVWVTGAGSGGADPFYFDGWEEVLGRRFTPIFREEVADSSRPYRLVVLARRRAAGHTP
jgi:SAM-dependent methyltransferase